jgi:uncharacterized SAM-binding protein YcdF (DUF218 family)
MFFILSKILGFVAVPSNLLALIGLAGIFLLFTRFVRAGRRLLVANVILIVAIGVLPVGNALILPLEDRFPPWHPMQGAPAGIIVIGGVIDPERSEARGRTSLNETAERVTVAVELARQYPTARIVFSGGTANLFSDPSEADFAASFFESLGVPRNRITLETQSRNTAENAVFTKGLIAPKPDEPGCWSRRPSICHARSARFVRPVSQSKPFRSIIKPMDGKTCGSSQALS